jgi:hypothetical protein
MNCFSKIDSLFKHLVLGTPSRCNIQGNRHGFQIVVRATFPKCFPKQRTPPDQLGKPTKLGKSREKHCTINVLKVLEKVVDEKVNDMSDATDITSLVIPFDIATEEEFFQFSDEGAIVASVVRGDAEQFVGEIKFIENIKDNFGKVFAGVTPLELFESEQRLMEVKTVVNVMSGDCYTEVRMFSE